MPDPCNETCQIAGSLKKRKRRTFPLLTLQALIQSFVIDSAALAASLAWAARLSNACGWMRTSAS
jgi:hypothetical protein